MSRTAAPRQSIPFSSSAPKASDGSTPLPPSQSDDIISVINASGNATTDDGPLTIIDIQNDMRYMLPSWIYSIQHVLQASAYNSSPHASPASVLAYVIVLFSGLMFFNEHSARPFITEHAQTIMNDALYMQFFSLLLDMPVPPFAANEFLSNRAYFHPIAKNLCFVPNFSSASFLHDFGRLFPASTFIRLHNLMSNLPANTTPALLSYEFYRQVVATVEFTPGTAVNITPTMLFGAHNGTNWYNNWLRTRVDRIITALAIRPVFTAPTIGPLPVNPTSNTLANGFNAYLWISGITLENNGSMTTFVRSLGSFIQATFPGSRPLRDFCQPGTVETERHLIFTAPVPTWSTTASGLAASTDNAVTSLSLQTSATMRSHETYATDINFLDARPDPTTAPANGNAFFTANIGRDADPVPDKSLNVRLTPGAAPPVNAPDPVNWMLRASAQNTGDNALRYYTAPPCLIFDPDHESLGPLAFTLTSGKIIEHFDISSVGVHLARPELLLHTTNGTLIQGAIPLHAIRTALTTDALHIEAPPTLTHTTLPQSFTTGDPSRHALPRYRQGIVQLAVNAYTDFLQVLPGIAVRLNARSVFRAVNFFARRQGETIEPPATDLVALWSSYRYREITGNTTQIAMIPSLRYLEGTSARHVRSNHPSLRIH